MSNSLEFYNRAAGADSQLRSDELPMNFPAHIRLEQLNSDSLTFGYLRSQTKAEKNTPGIDMRLRICTQQSHISCLVVQWVVRWKKEGVEALQRTRKELFLTGLNTSSDIEVVNPGDTAEIAKDTGTPESHVKDLASQNALAQIRITLLPDNGVLACNLLTDALCGDATSDFVKLAAMLASKDPITLTMTAKGSSENLRDIIGGVADAFAADREAGDFVNLKAWWPTEKRPNPQLGMGLTAEARPQVRIPIKFNIFNLEEYVTMLYYGIVPQLELVEARTKEQPLVRVRFAEIGTAGNRRYWAFIEPVDEMRLETGDSITLNFKVDMGSKEDNWQGTVAQTPSFTPWGDTAVHLARKWRRDDLSADGGTWDDLDLPAEAIVTVGEETTIDEIRRRLTDCRCVEAILGVNDSDLALRRQVNGVNALWLDRHAPQTRQKVQTLLGNKPALLSRKSAFSHMPTLAREDIERDIATSVSKANLDSAQEHALHALTEELPSGIHIVFGGAGTGKSQVAREAINVALRIRQRTNTKTRILVVCPSNKYTDEVAQKIRAEAIEVCGGTDMPCIIRAHASDTDHSVATAAASESRRKQNAMPARQPLQQDAEATALLNELAGAQEVLKLYQAHVARKFAGIKDSRMQLLDMSLGNHILQATRGGSKFARFREFLSQWERNEEFSAEQKAAFKEQYNEAVELVLGTLADIVVTTMSQALTPAMYASFRPDWVVAEELGRVAEGEFAAMTAFYSPHHMILVGDVYQLAPVVKMPRDAEYFRGQLSTSPLTRMIATGYRQTEMSTQHRSHQSITELLRELAYPTVKAGPAVAERASCGAIQRLFRQLFGPALQSTVAWAETTGGTDIDSRRSAFNIGNVKVGLYWLARMIKGGVRPSDIMILVPYTAQICLYEEMLRKSASWYTDHTPMPANESLAEVRVESIDNVQGTESSVVILDTTVSDRLGFMAVRNRIVVALSRAKDGVLLIGSSKLLESNTKRGRKLQETALSKTWEHCKRAGTWFENQAEHELPLDDILAARQDARDDFNEPLRIASGVTRADPPSFEFSPAGDPASRWNDDQAATDDPAKRWPNHDDHDDQAPASRWDDDQSVNVRMDLGAQETTSGGATTDEDVQMDLGAQETTSGGATTEEDVQMALRGKETTSGGPTTDEDVKMTSGGAPVNADDAADGTEEKQGYSALGAMGTGS